MCLTAPVRVVSIDGALATVDVAGVRQVVSSLAVPSVRPGDWAILSAGMLLRVLDPTTASLLAQAFHVATSADGPGGRTAGIRFEGGES